MQIKYSIYLIYWLIKDKNYKHVVSIASVGVLFFPLGILCTWSRQFSNSLSDLMVNGYLIS